MNILLIGCGKMGSSLLQGWKKSGIKNVQVIDPALGKTAAKIPVNFKPDYMVLAIKPQSFAAVLPELKKYNCPAISIAAGKSIKSIKKLLGNRVIIRAMPNLPATIGMGVTGVFSASKLNPMAKKQVTSLLAACGSVIWLKKEEDINKITAISGSGPAYVFLFAESMVKAAEKLGFSVEQANELVFSTMLGSLKMAEKSDVSLASLITNVASKGGTTEAALKIFKSRKFGSIIDSAVQAAYKRAQQLAD